MSSTLPLVTEHTPDFSRVTYNPPLNVVGNEMLLALTPKSREKHT